MYLPLIHPAMINAMSSIATQQLEAYRQMMISKRELEASREKLEYLRKQFMIQQEQQLGSK